MKQSVEQKIQQLKHIFGQYEDQNRSSKIYSILEEHYLEELLTAPASVNKEYHHCYPGGLIDYTFKVVEILDIISSLVPYTGYTTDERITVSILHVLGKLGTPDQPYYIPETDKWKIGKGYKFKISEKYVGDLEQSHRTLLAIHTHGIPLTKNEYTALQVYSTLNKEDSGYLFREVSKLAVFLNYATGIAMRSELPENIEKEVSEKIVEKKKTVAHNSKARKIEKVAEKHEIRMQSTEQQTLEQAQKLFQELFHS